MPAPDAVLKISEAFAEHREHFRSGNYNEFQLAHKICKGNWENEAAISAFYFPNFRFTPKNPLLLDLVH